MSAYLLPPGLLLNRSSKFLGMIDQYEGFGRAASSADDDGSIGEQPADDRLFDADAFHSR